MRIFKNALAGFLTAAIISSAVTMTSHGLPIAQATDGQWIKINSLTDITKSDAPITTITPSAQITPTQKNKEASPLLTLTNTERRKAGAPSLRENAKLDRAAQMKADDMIKEQYWDHDSPSGKSPWYWFQKAGYIYTDAGENLAKNYANDAETTEGWMNSPGHRANLLNKKYKEVGFGKASGVIDGEKVTITVAHYGSSEQ